MPEGLTVVAPHVGKKPASVVGNWGTGGSLGKGGRLVDWWSVGGGHDRRWAATSSIGWCLVVGKQTLCFRKIGRVLVPPEEELVGQMCNQCTKTDPVSILDAQRCQEKVT